MYIDKDSWGKYSINDLSERELFLLREALRVYAQLNLGRIHPMDNVAILSFDHQFNSITRNGKEKQQKMELPGR
ncbi:ornithine aminotransferase [Prevotella intermedia]|uniref:ornithine aminotransferase n=1 Tax=Prevotella intermedia TaxID=28131 RepID=UPI000C1BF220|nr:ornithine aminotransferase [Prevotella intermedia]ATV32513.1 ornithine aminotransferase [Prevotella intermedia]ATV41075.1 ornithine aminotransferase [Prevotella intermedia]